MKTQTNFNVDSFPVAHMAAQIRARQLATKSTQDHLQKKIVEALENNLDSSGESIVQKIRTDIASNLKWMNWLNKIISDKDKVDLGAVGFPIKFNKTAIQLKMALDWVERNDDVFLSDKVFLPTIEFGFFYHKLRNDVSGLPALQSPSMTEYWGNENPAVSTVLLWSVASTLGVSLDPSNLAGAGAFYPFLKEGYSLKNIPSTNNVFEAIDILPHPFISEDGMFLFGDYQLGGHRYFSNEHPGLGQRLFSPEDCSSAVGKATGLRAQVVNIYAGAIKAAYTDSSNGFGYKPVTTSDNGVSLDLDLIQPGDIYLRGGHTAIMSGISNQGEVASLEFNRDIDRPNEKLLGGGYYERNLLDSNDNTNPIFVLRKAGLPIKESCSSSDLLARIDSNYKQFCDAYGLVDRPGDASIFLKEHMTPGDCKTSEEGVGLVGDDAGVVEF